MLTRLNTNVLPDQARHSVQSQLAAFGCLCYLFAIAARLASQPLVFSAMKPVVDAARNVSNQPCGNQNFRWVRGTHTHSLQ